jgi:hypothetical protein
VTRSGESARQLAAGLRPALREAANALRVATGPLGQARRPLWEAVPEVNGHGRDTAVTDVQADEEASAIAELGQLLDALSDTVTALAEASKPPRRGHLRSLGTRLAQAGVRATELSWPDDEDPAS